VPFALVAQTASVSKAQAAVVSSVASPSATGAALLPASLTTASSPVEKVPTQPKPDSLDSLLERQKQAPMPVLYGERPEGDEVKGDRLRAGIDGMTVEELSGHLREHWPAIREQLLNGTYKPQPVKRVEIAKPDGGMRQLGIPTVLDRMVQQAVMQVLQRRWDSEFSEHSHGFRPGR